MSDDPVAEQVELAVSVQSGTARAAVLGIDAGLVADIALILGVAARQRLDGMGREDCSRPT